MCRPYIYIVVCRLRGNITIQRLTSTKTLLTNINSDLFRIELGLTQY